MKIFLRILCVVALLSAQSNPRSLGAIFYSPQQSALTPMLEDGTPIRLRLSQTISSADAHVDDRVAFEVLEEVRVADMLVIAKGGIAWGTVTEAQPKRNLARGGKLEIVMDSVRLADGQKAALRAVKTAKGGGHTGAMTVGIVATGLLFWPAAPFFLFMHGKDITIPKGAEVPTFINGDFKLDAAKFRNDAPVVAEARIPQATGVPATVSSTVAIVSTPTGAEIFLDHKFVGNTPSSTIVGTGQHLISVKKDGFKEWEREITLSGGNVNLTAELIKGLDVPVTSPSQKSVSPALLVVQDSAAPVKVHRRENVQSGIEISTPPGWMGVSTKRGDGGGVAITALVPEGPAAVAGLKVGDTIMKLNGNPLGGEDFNSQISSYKFGSKVAVTYVRGSWASIVIVTVGVETL
jgi:hypothetical protein